MNTHPNANSNFDIIVIGAGPAGIAAATTAHSEGCTVCLLDEQPDAGGQIYRGLTTLVADRGDASDNKKSASPLMQILGSDYLAGKPLLEQLQHTRVQIVMEATVWQLGTDGCVTYSRHQQVSRIVGRHIILATGAMERPFPVPGWTLPGVMTAGAAQIALKTSGLIPVDAILVGTGPLLYYFATQLIRANHAPKALVDTSPGLKATLASAMLDGIRRSETMPVKELPAEDLPFREMPVVNKRSSRAHLAASLPSVLSQRRQLVRGLSMLRQIQNSGVAHYRAAHDLEILGDKRVQSIRFRHNGKATENLSCDMILLHDGIVPNTQMSRSLGLHHQWNSAHRYFAPVTDDCGVSSSDNISIAGDSSGIVGAVAAAQHGTLVAMRALASFDYRTDVQSGLNPAVPRKLKKHVTSARQFQQLLASLYPPHYSNVRVPDAAVVCRCEQVFAADIRECVKIGCTGPNQIKSYTRCGMGPCQGRYCGLTVTEIIAQETSLSEDTVGSFRVRSPLKPVTLAELASLATEAPAVDESEVPESEVRGPAACKPETTEPAASHSAIATPDSNGRAEDQ